MTIGETVLVRVNGGQLCEGYVIEIHGDIVRIAGPEECAIAKMKGEVPLGVGFRVQDILPLKKANCS